MSRRARAIGFLLLALLAAGLAAAIADGYGSSVARGYGPLRPVVIVSAALPASKPLGPTQLESSLEVRRVPARFAPPGALSAPAEAVGLAPAAAIPVGSYLLASQLRPPGAEKPAGHRLGGELRAVEIGVTGAAALLATGTPRRGAKVDVVVTTEPGGGGRGRAYVAAAGVPLLALRPGADDLGAGGAAAATLGLTRRQALSLIAAESYARKLTLLPGG